MRMGSNGAEGDGQYCVECEDVPAQVLCQQCQDSFCGLCFFWLHKKGNRAGHSTLPLSGGGSVTQPSSLAGTTEHFTEMIKNRTSPMEISRPVGMQDDDSGDRYSKFIRERSKFIPLRLTSQERVRLNLLEGILETSEYTDQVDVSFDYFGWRTGGLDKTRIIEKELREILALTMGMFLANDFNSGRRMVEKDFVANAEAFCDIFEIGRRFKILNPDKMRTTYVKLMHLLQDTVSFKTLDFSCVRAVRTVAGFLEDKKMESLLDDSLLRIATSSISSQSKSREEIEGEVEVKKQAQSELCQKYRCESMSADEVQLVLDSLSDANSYLLANRDPVDRMLQYLEHYFSPMDSKGSLELNYGQGGSRLSHSHSEQFIFVRQTLKLWKEIQEQMFYLWIQAEKDFLSPAGYRLCNTGQGLQRVQPAPHIGNAMHRILSSVQGSLASSWVGLSVVHLGDRDVPNAIFFIDKYTQVPRILNPIVQTLENIEKLAQDPGTAQLVSQWGGKDKICKTILCDFFRHGFDGSGSDGGSCVDGRLTSCWNWCSKIEKKVYFPVFLLSNFDGFDGSFRR